MELSQAEKLEAAVEALRKCEERSLAGQFALEVMHEIRNPLDAIGNLIYLALNANALTEAKEHMKAAKEHVVSLHQIAGQSLTLTRNTQTATPVDLVTLSEAALRVHHRRVMVKQIQLKRDLCEEATVAVRMGEILQVLSNLIGNALDALPQRGTISLRIRKRSDHLSLIVADNGHGISAENLSRLFQPFFTTKNDQGTGLGLALSRKIIERHGGKISVRSSTHPGKNGTTFLIRLPLAGTPV